MKKINSFEIEIYSNIYSAKQTRSNQSARLSIDYLFFMRTIYKYKYDLRSNQ